MAKNILITGGAGFVGSHLADALLAAGHNVRVFDNLTEQVHQDGIPDYLSPEAEFVYGDVQDASALGRALNGIDVVFHMAAAVGVGQSMYEIERYMGSNTQGTAVLLQELLRRLDRVQKLVLASSMSIYGEGKYLCAQCGELAPAPRSTVQLRAKQWDPLCAVCGAPLQPVPTDESKPLQCSSIYSLSKKDQEEMCLLFGRTYGLPVVARQTAADFRGRGAIARLCQRAGRGAREPALHGTAAGRRYGAEHRVRPTHLHSRSCA
jgi:dTDP-L-rhamnose 4-epimerase